MSQSAETNHRTTLSLEQGYRFRVRFDREGIPDLLTDESPPIGEDTGPSPSRLLATAIGNCLAASLVFCLRKARLSVEGLEAEVLTEFTRNETGRLRIANIRVRLLPHWTAETSAKAQRCLGIFEDFCIVTASVRHGVPVAVEVADATTPGTAAGGT